MDIHKNAPLTPRGRAELAFGEQRDQGFAVSVADRVEFRVQAALGAADTAGNSPFLSRLAAARRGKVRLDASKPLRRQPK